MLLQICSDLLVQLLRQRHCTVHSVQSDKGGLTVFTVAANGLAQLLWSAGNIQHIVHDLEHQSQPVCVGCQYLTLLRCCTGRSSAHLDGGVDQRTGLVAMDKAQLFLGGCQRFIFQIQLLSVDHAAAAGTCAQRTGGCYADLRCSGRIGDHLKGLGQQHITGKHCR